MRDPINPLDHPICLAIPERQAQSAWLEHTPFAMWLTSALRPRILVELGTYYGTSYCAFCQAIASLGLPTRAFAVDTWEGDPHSGPLLDEALDDLRQHHDHRYARFSTLLHMTFDEALPRFADGEIDLLHIDGYHTYEVVRHDFENWRPKVSDRGIILFHDVEDRNADFGVWRLWEELTAEHPSFTFVHEHGLGVLALGPDVPDEVRSLLDLRGPDIEPVRTVFNEMGRRLRLQIELQKGRAERDAARAERDTCSAERDAARAERDAARAERDVARADWDAARADWEAAAVEREAFLAQRDAARAERDTYLGERDAARAERDTYGAERDAARAERDAARAGRDAARAELDQALSALRLTEERLASVQSQWDELLSSQSWRAFYQVHLLGTRIGPDGSRRRRALKRIAHLLEVLGREGAIGFARRKVKQAVDRKMAYRAGSMTGGRQEFNAVTRPGVARGATPHSSQANSHTRVG